MSDIWNQQYCDTCKTACKDVVLVLREPHEHMLLCKECIKAVRQHLSPSEYAHIFCYRLLLTTEEDLTRSSGVRNLYTIELKPAQVVLLRLLGYEIV